MKYKIIIEMYDANGDADIRVIDFHDGSLRFPGATQFDIDIDSDEKRISKYLQSLCKSCEKMSITVIFNRKNSSRFVYKPVKGAIVNKIGQTFYNDTKLYDAVIGYIRSMTPVLTTVRSEKHMSAPVKRTVGKEANGKIIVVDKYDALAGLVIRE